MVARCPTSVQTRVVLALGAVLSLFGCQLVAGDFEIAEVKNQETGFCKDDEFRCENEYLLACNSDLTDFTVRDTCPTSELCDSMLGQCRRCTEGDQRCDGVLRQECNEDGTAWSDVEECLTDAMCNPTFCGNCTAGEYACRGMGDTVDRELWKCGPDNTWSNHLATCVSAGVCAVSLDMARTDPNWSGECVATPCDTPGSYTCEGPELRRCRQDLSGFDVVDTCASEALCGQAVDNATATGGVIERCPIGCFTAGSFICEDQFLLRCRDDLTGYDAAPEACPEGTDCNPMQGNCGPLCTAGEYQCNGAELRRCVGDGVWEEVAICASSVLCTITEFEPTMDGMGSRGIAGMCQEPTCPAAGEFMCEGATLLKCRQDLTAWEMVDECASSALCLPADGRCREPICNNEELRCFDNELRRCSPGLTDWHFVETCEGGYLCDNDPTDPGCKLDCPAATRCNGAELERCTPKGWVHQATCPTTDLCTCTLAEPGSPEYCTLGLWSDGCGTPVCGGTQAGYQCAGSVLQRCEAGRDGWETVQDCGSAALCYPGAEPMFQMGYCAICPTAGEVRCSTTTPVRTETCSADRRSWAPNPTCNSTLGCIDAGPMDYCAICALGQAQCSSATLQVCGSDRRSWVSTNCGSAALCDAANDQCDVCANENTYSCTGQTLHYCTPDGQQDQTQNCPNRCDATGGECDSCNPGTSRCMNTTLYTCNANGQTETSQTCVTSALCNAGANRCDTPACNVGQTRCTGTQPEICNTGRNGWVSNGAACATAALCNADGTCTAPTCGVGDRRCNGAQPQVCNANRNGWTDSGAACASAVLCTGMGVCGTPACGVGETRCNGAQPQVCNANRNGWNNMGTLCASSALCVAATGTCNMPVCEPNETRCQGAQPQVCRGDLTGWQNVGSMPCETAALCIAETATCNQPACDVGERRCTGAQPEICNPGRTGYQTDGPACATAALCSGGTCATPTCDVGEMRCNGAQPQICNSGRNGWTNMGPACATAALCRTDGTCDTAECDAGEIRCNGAQPQQCNADQNDWNNLNMGMPCATAALCNATAGTCTTPTCSVGQRRCMGAQPQICNMDRNGWDNAGDPCATAELCGFMTTGICSLPACDAGAVMCSGAQPQICNAGRTGYEDNGQACATQQLCGFMTPGACSTPACAVNQRTCSGAQPQICNAGRTGFQNNGDPCATPELCGFETAGTCSPPACAVGEWRCSGPNLQQCLMDRTDWMTQDMCDSAALCDDVGMECDECEPDDAECVDTLLRECTDTGHWMETNCALDGRICDPGPPPVCMSP